MRFPSATSVIPQFQNLDREEGGPLGDLTLHFHDLIKEAGPLALLSWPRGVPWPQRKRSLFQPPRHLLRDRKRWPKSAVFKCGLESLGTPRDLLRAG